jgi:dual specificity tyrosine-phosphorylation-regulated kinase 1
LLFELLSHSLYDVLRATSFRGVSLALVRKFSFQILHALSYLKSHGVVHLDLKPENVLLCSTDRSRVKLVDFGSSRWVNEKEETNLYAQSRFYRAAEVLLGLPCGCPADVWSLGCIMVELHGGKPLFPGRDERHQLCKIAETLGPVPEDMFAKASAERRKTHAHAAARRETDDGTLADADGPSADVRKQFATLGFVPKPHGSRPLRTVIAAASSAFEARQRERQSSSARGDDKLVENKRADAAATSMRALGLERDGEDFQSSRDFSRDDAFADAAETFSAEEARLTSVALFCDVVERFLTYAPELRAQPGTALEHPFFSADGAARGGFEALFFRGETMGETSFDEPFTGVDDEMLMYGLEGTDA